MSESGDVNPQPAEGNDPQPAGGQPWGPPGGGWAQGAPTEPAGGSPPAPPPPQAYPAPPALATQVPPGMYLDPVSQLVLPDGTQLAGVGRRIGAYFLSIVLAIVTLGIGYIIWGLVIWGRGQTPTYQVLKMRCWRPETGQVAGWWWMALREIIGRIVDGILSIITSLVSFILFLSTKEHRSLHDMVAGTVVLYDPNEVLR